MVVPDILAKSTYITIKPKKTRNILAYSIKCKKFAQWWGEGRAKDLPISKARNLFLAHSIDKSQHISLPTISISAPTFFLGEQKGADKDIETSLLDSAARSRAPVKHRVKISTANYSKIVRLGLPYQDPKAFSIVALTILLFRGFLRVSEAVALKISDLAYAEGLYSSDGGQFEYTLINAIYGN
ncbi:hypothetical protein TELCIR_16069 [Teladorsagia circumcincta]|uniref:Tyr recombinase domain-containing protein n=1 Tax=Teladorsagia circumcincta TaxID=45464 RepID=A0A2G9TWI6_TELCI|nr:hypothetical protein TELCIR_16069 [Teladorsagia circumcincta]